MFRREPRDPIERPLSQLRQHLEQTTSEPESLAEDEFPSTGEFPSSTYQRPAVTWQPLETTPRPVAPAASDRQVSIVAANARWEGTLESQGSLIVHGTVKGTIRATQDVTIAEGATVDAEIAAQNVSVHGTVRGRIEASGRLEIHPSGEVVGEVQAPSLIVHEGARLSGTLRMGTAEAEPRTTGGRA
ncbi:MAG: polymer-forming cytoskeletal protein [Thermomicrobium sp.]|nr:polymer-forming cytoskeletal protein [Thermomicrobium sp.]MDW8060655.1 polymer-forming cytoskeletal protein [Thermomicrobium sp.]